MIILLSACIFFFHFLFYDNDFILLLYIIKSLNKQNTMHSIPSFQKILTSCNSTVTDKYHSNNIVSTKYKEKSDGTMEIYLLEKYLRQEFKDKLHMSEQEIVESLQNLILYLKLKLVELDDIVTDNFEIKKINKIVIINRVVVYDTQKYPIHCKKLKYSSVAKNDKINTKLKKILS